MGYRTGYGFLFSFLVFFSYVLIVEHHGGEAYRNYTVGESLGWYDDLMEPKVDYQKWAEGKDFGLGDFLIFNTDKNHSVVQTYNETTYKRCDYDDAEADDTTEWSAGEPTFDAASVTVPVPLLKVGSNFFFSGNYDGEQCRHGQHFVINVTHGQGLPPSLDPSGGSPAPTSGDEGDTVPETVVPSNFNDPEGAGDVKATAGAARLLVGLLMSGFFELLIVHEIALTD